MQESFKRAMDELAQAKNKKTMAEEMAANQWADGDTCGEKGCENEVREQTHPKPENEIPANREAPQFEYVCIHHGIVAQR